MKENEATSGLRGWTDRQLAAISHDTGDLLVSAAAGSGKTAVLAERCARLVCENAVGGRCGVESLLVVTFTESAASEMRTRIAAAILRKTHEAQRSTAGGKSALSPEDLRWLRRQSAMVERASISTLHGFCHRVLKQHFHEAGIDPGFEVIEQEEAELLREEVLEELFAAWYRASAPGSAAGAEGADWHSGFGEFFESYAFGRESTCREMILKLHNMLASTADRAVYLEGARRVYRVRDGRGGPAETLEYYVKITLAGKLRLAAITAARACAQVAEYPGTEKMLAALQGAAERIRETRRVLERDGVKGWASARESLNYDWPRLNRIKEIDSFQELKDRTWEATKTELGKLREIFEPDPKIMLDDLHRIGGAVDGAPTGPLDVLIGMAEEFDRAYTAAKRAQNRVDFNDLERLTLDLFRRPDGRVVQELRRRYRHVLVDEFQDINPLQHALLAAVRSPGDGGNWFLVGDVKQSIYGFRLAEPGLFLGLEQAWRNHADKYVALPHNFRSRPGLLDVMNGIFGRLMTPEVAGVDYFPDHALIPGQAPGMAGELNSGTDSRRAHPVEMHLVVLDRAGAGQPQDNKKEEEPEGGGDEDDDPLAEQLSAVEHEARMAARLIEAMIREGRPVRDMKTGRLRPVEYRDIAILLRTVKNKAMLFSRALDDRGIPLHADLSSGYFDTPEVCDALALLQVLDNPKQDIPLATVMLGPYGGFSHDELALVRLTYDRKEIPFAEAAARYARDAANARGAPGDPGEMVSGVQDFSPDAPPFSEVLALRLAALSSKLRRWRELLAARPLHEGLAEIYAESRILAYVSGFDARGSNDKIGIAGGDGGTGGGQRAANLQMLHQRALQFSGFRKQGLHRFLRFIERLRKRDTDFGEAPVLSAASNVVRIMSVHKSKGLEFPVVFVSGLGGLLPLRDLGGSIVQVHRSLGIGMMAVDAERNVIYPTAASARIADAEACSKRAEELRLLYVAMTRARDHLLLTGHIAREGKIDEWREQWKSHAGPLPEDVILKGRTPLDWLIPAIACGRPIKAGKESPAHTYAESLRVNWNGASHPADQLSVTLHSPAEDMEKPPIAAPDPQREERIRIILGGEPLADPPAPDEKVARMIARVTGQYAHADLAREPAVRTVTYLKTVSETEAGIAEPPPAPGMAGLAHAPDTAAAEHARLRGIATHRILELLDFTHSATEAAVDDQIAHMIEARALTQEESAAADRAGILWFLHHSASGARIIAAAKRAATGDPAIRLRREIPFTWTTPLPNPLRPTSTDPADWPTIRGVMDLLLVQQKTAELLDYKTDSPHLWQSRLPDYERQMRYYLQAASEILGFRVERATLVFLAARTEREVT